MSSKTLVFFFILANSFLGLTKAYVETQSYGYFSNRWSNRIGRLFSHGTISSRVTVVSVIQYNKPTLDIPVSSPFISRKIGNKNQINKIEQSINVAPTPSLSMDHQATKENSSSSNAHEENGKAQAQEPEVKKHHRRPFDKSIAGGGVILGGLATTFLAAVLCYIKATRRHKSESKTDTIASTP